MTLPIIFNFRTSWSLPSLLVICGGWPWPHLLLESHFRNLETPPWIPPHWAGQKCNIHCNHTSIAFFSEKLKQTSFCFHNSWDLQMQIEVMSVMHCNYWYLNLICCSSMQHPLRTVGKMDFWNWNSVVMLGSITVLTSWDEVTLS